MSGLAVRNITSGNVRITNSGAVTLMAVDILNGFKGNLVGNFAPGGTTAFTTSGPFTYAFTCTSDGTLTQTTGDNNPAHTDNITVNAGVTVQSTGGNVVFLAGDDIVINSTAQVLAQSGNIDLPSGFNDTDNEGAITLNRTIFSFPYSWNRRARCECDEFRRGAGQQ